MHNCALRIDDAIICWGYKAYGQTDVPFGFGRFGIVQITEPSSFTDTFGFTSTVAMTPTFSLGHGMTETFDVDLGIYTVTQTAETGFTLSAIDCSAEGQGLANGGQAVITITQDADITCTFSNTRDIGTLLVTKVTSPAGLTDSFAFTVTDRLDVSEVFTLTDSTSQTLTLSTGVYTVMEAVTDGFELVSAVCTGAVPSPGSNSVRVTVSREQTTTCTFTNEVIPDDDGVAPSIEPGAPNDGDGNGDSTPDYLQNHVVSTPNGQDGKYVTFAAASSIQLTGIMTDAAPLDPPDNAAFPIGIVGFTMEIVAAGATVTITLHLEGGTRADAYYKRVRGVWSVDPHAEFVDDRTIILTLTDNGSGDSDPMPGRIVDPGAPAGLPLNADVFVSTWEAGIVDGLSYGAHDILQWDGDAWTKRFDGAAAGLSPTGRWRHNINAFSLSSPSSSDIYLSLTQDQQQVGVLGWVDGYDILRWDGSALSRWFEGERVGLNFKTQEKIDGLHVLAAAPEWSEFAAEDCAAYLLISTQGPGLVPKPGNIKPKNVLKFSGEDVLGFCWANLGGVTAGRLEIVIDGSAEGVSRNNVDSLSLSADGRTLYLMSKAQFRADAAFGGHSMVFAFDLAAEQADDGEFSGPLFKVYDAGMTISAKVDGLDLR